MSSAELGNEIRETYDTPQLMHIMIAFYLLHGCFQSPERLRIYCNFVSAILHEIIKRHTCIVHTMEITFAA